MSYTFYKIVCKDETNKSCYVGSSIDFLSRKYKHKQDCYNIGNKPYNLKLYQHIRDNGGFDNFDFIVLEEKECDKEEALWIERKYIKDLCADLNTIKKPIATDVDKKERAKEYRENNIDKMKEYDKEYRENNKDKIKKKDKEYYEKNKDIIKDKKKEKITCECGSIVCRDTLAKHNKTKKHRMFIDLRNWRETIYETIFQ